MKSSRVYVLAGLVAASLLSTHAQAAAVAVRAGSFGYGADVDFGLTKKLNLRLGYNTFDLSRTIEDTDVTYDGKLKIGAASAILDWHVFDGGFRLSLGAVSQGPKVDIVGKPSSNNTFELNNHVYTASQIGSINGTIKIGDGAAPYLGLGWGNTVDEEDRITFLLDLGVIHTGTPKTSLTVTCNSALPVATCNQLQNDANAEKAELDDNVTGFEWYPVISLGLAVRF